MWGAYFLFMTEQQKDYYHKKIADGLEFGIFIFFILLGIAVSGVIVLAAEYLIKG